MKKIDKRFFDLLESRFYNCFDSVVNKINIIYDRDARWPNVTMEIETQDSENDGGWSNLLLSLEEVKLLKFKEGKATYRILSDGISFSANNDGFCLNFEDTDEDESEFIIKCTKGSWECASEKK